MQITVPGNEDHLGILKLKLFLNVNLYIKRSNNNWFSKFNLGFGQ
jgi:hypothetical protein